MEAHGEQKGHLLAKIIAKPRPPKRKIRFFHRISLRSVKFQTHVRNLKKYRHFTGKTVYIYSRYYNIFGILKNFGSVLPEHIALWLQLNDNTTLLYDVWHTYLERRMKNVHVYPIMNRNHDVERQQVFSKSCVGVIM